MATIIPLPHDTARILQSCLTLSTPLSIVKEVLDNSIDAKASVVDVLVAADTISKIEVRDNGEGIAVQDFPSLGRAGFTSKLRNLDELKNLGGTSLGFRGGALAAMCEMGKVVVTTRTASDTVATTFDLLDKGRGYDNARKMSAPVGTCVVVSQIFSGFPVRKRVATKEARSTVARMKQLLQAYAMARPALKLSFREIGSSCLQWSYSPRPEATVSEAALDLLGPDLASQCTRAVRHSKSVASGAAAEEWFEIEAVIPRSDAVLSKVASKGAFVSVDSRPVSAFRGTFKRLIAEFKTHLNQCLIYPDGKPVKDPFICLSIRSSPGAYDVNLEPMKDNLVFADEQALLALCTDLFRDSYATPESTRQESIPDTREDNEPGTRQEEHLTRHEHLGTVGSSPRLATRNPSPTPVGRINVWSSRRVKRVQHTMDDDTPLISPMALPALGDLEYHLSEQDSPGDSGQHAVHGFSRGPKRTPLPDLPRAELYGDHHETPQRQKAESFSSVLSTPPSSLQFDRQGRFGKSTTQAIPTVDRDGLRQTKLPESMMGYQEASRRPIAPLGGGVADDQEDFLESPANTQDELRHERVFKSSSPLAAGGPMGLQPAVREERRVGMRSSESKSLAQIIKDTSPKHCETGSAMMPEDSRFHHLGRQPEIHVALNGSREGAPHQQLQRRLSRRQPLETRTNDTLSLVQGYSVTAEELEILVAKMAGHDNYMGSGGIHGGLKTLDVKKDAATIDSDVKRLVLQTLGPDFEIDVRSALVACSSS